jgi:hypothetical protein
MNHKLGHDEHQQGNQESNVRLDVMQERDPEDSAKGVALDHRQYQERQPRQQGDCQDSAP